MREQRFSYLFFNTTFNFPGVTFATNHWHQNFNFAIPYVYTHYHTLYMKLIWAADSRNDAYIIVSFPSLSFFHQQTFIEHLLCASHYSGCCIVAKASACRTNILLSEWDYKQAHKWVNECWVTYFGTVKRFTLKMRERNVIKGFQSMYRKIAFWEHERQQRANSTTAWGKKMTGEGSTGAVTLKQCVENRTGRGWHLWISQFSST